MKLNILINFVILFMKKYIKYNFLNVSFFVVILVSCTLTVKLVDVGKRCDSVGAEVKRLLYSDF